MEANVAANSTTQQHNRRVLVNQSCYTPENTHWSYPTFYPRLHTSSCSEFGTCKLCQPLPSYSNCLQMYVPEQQSPQSNNHNMDCPDDTQFFHKALLPCLPASSPSPKSNGDQRSRYLTGCPTLPPPPPCDDHRFMSINRARHKCVVPGCGKTYERLSHLKAHLRWHGNPAPFKCKSASCGKRFSNVEKLHSHMKIHAK